MTSRYLINVLIGYCFKLIMCKYTNLIPKKRKEEEENANTLLYNREEEGLIDVKPNFYLFFL